MNSINRGAIAVVLALGSMAAIASQNPVEWFVSQVVEKLTTGSASSTPAAGTLEVAFSPKGGAEDLVLRVIDSSKQEMQVMAYSFTSAKVTSALLRAIKRGVAVSIIADEKHNLGTGSAKHAQAAFSALSEAGAKVRLTSAFAIHHDKVLISDQATVQLGSFNYSKAAATRNSENVIVNWNNPELAKIYRKHFERNWRLGKEFKAAY